MRRNLCGVLHPHASVAKSTGNPHWQEVKTCNVSKVQLLRPLPFAIAACGNLISSMCTTKGVIFHLASSCHFPPSNLCTKFDLGQNWKSKFIGKLFIAHKQEEELVSQCWIFVLQGPNCDVWLLSLTKKLHVWLHWGDSTMIFLLQRPVNVDQMFQSCVVSHSWNMLLKLLIPLATSWNALEMRCYLLKRLKPLMLLKRLILLKPFESVAGAPIDRWSTHTGRFKSFKSTPAVSRVSRALLKRAIETLAASCYLLKYSWNVMLSLETLETLDTLETQTRLEINSRHDLPDLTGGSQALLS